MKTVCSHEIIISIRHRNHHMASCKISGIVPSLLIITPLNNYIEFNQTNISEQQIRIFFSLEKAITESVISTRIVLITWNSNDYLGKKIRLFPVHRMLEKN